MTKKKIKSLGNGYFKVLISNEAKKKLYSSDAAIDFVLSKKISGASSIKISEVLDKGWLT